MSTYVCSVCGFVYDEAAGIPEKGIAPGTLWSELPDDWHCPICGAPKSSFERADEPSKSTQVSTPAEQSSSEEYKEFSPLELSILCSNLARGCEKQYRNEEAGLFRELADFFKSVAPQEQAPDMATILELVNQDLVTNLPKARAAAEADPRDRGALRAITWCEKVSAIQKSLLERYLEKGDALFENTGVWVCTICGFIFIGDNPPEICPVCKVPGWKFEKVEGRA